MQGWADLSPGIQNYFQRTGSSYYRYWAFNENSMQLVTKNWKVFLPGCWIPNYGVYLSPWLLSTCNNRDFWRHISGPKSLIRFFYFWGMIYPEITDVVEDIEDIEDNATRNIGGCLENDR